MRSRIAVATLLAVGSLLGTSSAAFATSALSTDTTASSLQYGTTTEKVQNVLGGNTGPGAAATNVVTPTAASVPAVAAPVEGSGVAATPEGAADVNNVSAGTSGSEAVPAAAVQAPRQLAAGSGSDASSLPFTGMALIPILLMGLALLGWGLLLRRRAGYGVASSV